MANPLLASLPDSLKPYRDKIESTIGPFIKISAQPSEELSLWQSKFGGHPYLPKHVPYPTDPDGTKMMFLGQLNFVEMPQLAGFPSNGILQFYIADDELMGLDVQYGSEVLYHTSVEQNEDNLQVDFSFMQDHEQSPVGSPCSLRFDMLKAPMSADDYQFEKRVFGIDEPQRSDSLAEQYDNYVDLFPGEGHKVGGYPYFTQRDPRGVEWRRDEGYQLLFQMDSDFKANIMWGDSGVGNFFIRPNDLANLDFSNVLYNWDCC